MISSTFSRKFSFVLLRVPSTDALLLSSRLFAIFRLFRFCRLFCFFGDKRFSKRFDKIAFNESSTFAESDADSTSNAVQPQGMQF